MPEELFLVVVLPAAARAEGDAGPIVLERAAADFVNVAQEGNTLAVIAHRRYPRYFISYKRIFLV